MIIDASADAVPGYCEELTGGPCGDCCGGPHIRQYVTRDMAMDAGDLSLEGQEL